VPAPEPPTKEKPMQLAVASQIGKHAEKEAAEALLKSPPARSVLHSAVYAPTLLPLPTCWHEVPAVELGTATRDVAAIEEIGVGRVVETWTGREPVEDVDGRVGLTATSTLDAEVGSDSLLLK
jgi:hypothetical protein